MSAEVPAFAMFLLTSLLVPGLIGYFSARWGASESRRQYEDQRFTRRLAACAEVFRIFTEIASTLERRILANDTFYSSKGVRGARQLSLNDIKLPENILAIASEISREIISEVLYFIAARAEANESILFSLELVDEDDAAHDLSAWAARLALSAYELSHKAANEGELKWKFGPIISLSRLESLMANAKPVGEYGTLHERQARSAAQKTMLKARLTTPSPPLSKR